VLSQLVRFQWWVRNLDLVVRHPQRGATAVEYGLMVALIAIVIIAAVTLLGKNVSSLFNRTATSV